MFYLKLIYKKTKELIEILFYRKKIKVDSNKKQVYLMLTATYENLGDIAITLTEIKFINEQLGEEYQLIEVPVEDTCKVFFDMKRKIKEDSIIILVGGGNNGDLYEFIEKRRRFILNKFKKYKIISFPQTVFYSNTKNGVKYKKLFFKLCEKCYDLTLVAREKGSYNLYIENVSKTKVLLSPDIVFYNNEDKEETRKGVSIVFRNDIEKLINEVLEKKIIEYVKSKNLEISYNDTCDLLYNSDRSNLFDDYLNLLRKKQLVITDRLHGMIMCYITNTPCLVFDNNNGKIKKTYDLWLKKQNFIVLCDYDDFKNIKSNIDSLLKINKIKKSSLINEYESLIKAIKEKNICVKKLK